VIINHQAKVAVDIPRARAFVRRVGRALKLGQREFNVCFVDDAQIRRLNALYRAKARPTDVLSFPWRGPRRDPQPPPASEFRRFLGEIVISAPAARRNARADGHSTQQEIRWLILHGLLHLLGYDHEKDSGEMTRLELALRDRLDGDRREPKGRGVKGRS
jgi:probable rRNA maturation factor